jgi:formate dehydrogenase
MLGARGHSLAELRDAPHRVIDFGPHLPGAFFEGHLQTPSRRVDCCPPAFADALERAEQIFLELESESDRALKLVSGREPLMHNSWYANVARLQRGERDRNYLYMHPLDAAERGLAEGSRVLVSNRNGSLEVELRTAEDLMRGAAALVHGFGHGDAPGLRGAQRSAGVNPNRLLPSGPGSFEPLSSQVHMTGIPIEVRAL